MTKSELLVAVIKSTLGTVSINVNEKFEILEYLFGELSVAKLIEEQKKEKGGK